MLGEGRPIAEPAVVSGDAGPVAARDLDCEITIEQMPNGNVRQGECLPHKIGPLPELRLEDPQIRIEPVERRRQGRSIAAPGRRADRRPEDRHGEVPPEGRLAPFGPHVDRGAGRRILGPERRAAVARREIAQDRGTLPDHEIAVPEHGHQPVRVERAERPGIEPAEPVPVVQPLEGQPQLGDAPHHRLDVRRGGAAIDRQRGIRATGRSRAGRVAAARHHSPRGKRWASSSTLRSMWLRM